MAKVKMKKTMGKRAERTLKSAMYYTLELFIDVLIVFFIVRSFSVAFDLTYNIFNDSAKDAGATAYVSVEIEKNSSAMDISKALYDAKVIKNKYVMAAKLWLGKYTTDIKAGVYKVRASMTYNEIIELLSGREIIKPAATTTTTDKKKIRLTTTENSTVTTEEVTTQATENTDENSDDSDGEGNDGSDDDSYGGSDDGDSDDSWDDGGSDDGDSDDSWDDGGSDDGGSDDSWDDGGSDDGGSDDGWDDGGSDDGGSDDSWDDGGSGDGDSDGGSDNEW